MVWFKKTAEYRLISIISFCLFLILSLETRRSLAGRPGSLSNTSSKNLYHGKVRIKVFTPALYTFGGKSVPKLIGVPIQIRNMSKKSIFIDRNGTFIMDRTNHASTFPSFADNHGRTTKEDTAVKPGTSAIITAFFKSPRPNALDRFELYCTIDMGSQKKQVMFHFIARRLKSTAQETETHQPGGYAAKMPDDSKTKTVMKMAAYQMLKNVMYGDRLAPYGGSMPGPPWPVIKFRPKEIPIDVEAIGQ
ncbi:MAG: hypothetical protein GXP49_02335 [Deltaproteobacteria bacterium]|nr:hypothetical protein [Deltaproteobacteria bacterium]